MCQFRLCYDNMALLNQRLYVCLVISFAQCRVTCRVCVCVWEREREGHITVESAVLTAACVQTHTSIITVSVTWLCSPLELELMVKLTTLLTVFRFTLKAEAHDYGKGRYISDACLWCSANHNALYQLANQSRVCLSEGELCRKQSVWERQGIEELQ